MPDACHMRKQASAMHQADTLCGAVLLELGPMLRDASLNLNPAVLLANALSAFALNLVRLLDRAAPVGISCKNCLAELFALLRVPTSCGAGLQALA